MKEKGKRERERERNREGGGRSKKGERESSPLFRRGTERENMQAGGRSPCPHGREWARLGSYRVRIPR